MKYSEEEKAMWVEDWRQSGKGAWVYAKANGLNPQTFVKWTKTIAEEKPCFVEVPAPVMADKQYEPEITD
jgi:transposase-like protein